MVYGYKCSTCGKLVEKVYDMNQDHPQKVKCPDCGTLTCHRHYKASIQVPYGFIRDGNRIKTEKRARKKFY